jgi:hypothetical protein
MLVATVQSNDSCQAITKSTSEFVCLAGRSRTACGSQTSAVFVSFCCTPHFHLRLQAQTFPTLTPAAFDIEVDANSHFLELLLAVATVDVACRYCTLAIGVEMGCTYVSPISSLTP